MTIILTVGNCGLLTIIRFKTVSKCYASVRLGILFVLPSDKPKCERIAFKLSRISPVKVSNGTNCATSDGSIKLSETAGWRALEGTIAQLLIYAWSDVYGLHNHTRQIMQYLRYHVSRGWTKEKNMEWKNLVCMFHDPMYINFVHNVWVIYMHVCTNAF